MCRIGQKPYERRKNRTRTHSNLCNAIVASNTSTIPIARIAEASRDATHVLGMHFFSPVPKMPLLEVIAPQGVSYVGDGELSRVCKIAHNVMLGVVIENLIEMTLLTNKMGVPRHAFLAFLNNGVMGFVFTRYKSPALSIATGRRIHAGTPAQRSRSRA